MVTAMSAALVADEVGNRSAGAGAHGVSCSGPRTTRPAEHAPLGELVEEGRRLDCNQPRHRNAAVGHDYFLTGTRPFDPARKLSPQCADGDVHVRSVHLRVRFLYNPPSAFAAGRPCAGVGGGSAAWAVRRSSRNADGPLEDQCLWPCDAVPRPQMAGNLDQPTAWHPGVAR